MMQINEFQKPKSYYVYTDGSVRKNKKGDTFGAWCALIIDEDGNETVLSKPVFDTTIGRMELTPILEALEYITDPSNVFVHSDSQYAINSLSKWLTMWYKAGWKNFRGESVKNVDILKKIYPLLSFHRVGTMWVRGHGNDVHNNRCDAIARSITLKMKTGKIKPLDNSTP